MKYLILLIFLIAIAVRFSYFPQNVYFAYDQARDSFFALDILKGDMRLIGPPSAASPNLFPGPLSLYIYSLVYLVFSPNPEILSAFFRLYNALGVFLVFLIGEKLFDKKVGIIASLLFALSYEQSQYSLFMSHQPLAVLTVLLFYLGLVILIFEKKAKGLIIASLGLGLSIQFHFVYIFLIPSLVMIFVFFKNNFYKLKFNIIFTSILTFMLSISTYIISEFKFDFRMLKELFAGPGNSQLHPITAFTILKRFIHDTYFANYNYSLYIIFLLVLVIAIFYWKQDIRSKIAFLLVWLIGGLTPYLFSGSLGYYYSAAATVSLMMIFSFFLSKMFLKFPLVGLALLVAVVGSNLFLINTQNPKGPNRDIVIQPGMLIVKEKEALDYVYQDSGGKPFAVKALTIPLNINTTWSFLFEWYGKEKYGYMPVWTEKPAEGFPGNIPFSTARSNLPDTQYIIIESTVGIPERHIEEFFKEEGYFTKSISKKRFGTIVVQKRTKV